jgi:hypothetical protein
VPLPELTKAAFGPDDWKRTGQKKGAAEAAPFFILTVYLSQTATLHSGWMGATCVMGRVKVG